MISINRSISVST